MTCVPNGNGYNNFSSYLTVLKNSTQITRILQIFADKPKKNSGNPFDLSNPCSILLHILKVSDG